MININKFVVIRKQLGLSQTELSEDICTQATLSKFENLGRIPSMRIMTQLCDRLNISLSDLIDERSSAELENLFSEADFKLITYDYEEIASMLEQLDVNRFSKSDWSHFNYLKGSLAMLHEQNLIDGLFYFNAILTDSEIDKTSIYYLLALTGCGQIYELQNDSEKAEHYFDLVFKQVMQKKIENDHVSIQILSILYQGGVFYAHKSDYKTSNALLNYAYQVCSDQHHTYYLARILFRLAENAQALNLKQSLIEQYLNDSAAFARINHNQHLLAKIANLTT